MEESRREIRLKLLPIKPSNPHPDTGILLRLADYSADLQKKSYVECGTQLKVPLVQLEELRGRRRGSCALSPESFQKLVVYIYHSSTVIEPRLPPRSSSVPALIQASSNYTSQVNTSRLARSHQITEAARAAASTRSSHIRPSSQALQTERIRRAARPELANLYHDLDRYMLAASQQPLRPARHPFTSYGTTRRPWAPPTTSASSSGGSPSRSDWKVVIVVVLAAVVALTALAYGVKVLAYEVSRMAVEGWHWFHDAVSGLWEESGGWCQEALQIIRNMLPLS